MYSSYQKQSDNVDGVSTTVERVNNGSSLKKIAGILLAAGAVCMIGMSTMDNSIVPMAATADKETLHWFPFSMTHPNSVKVDLVADNTVAVLNEEKLTAGLAREGVLKWANPATSSWSCVDGRSTEPVFGTPGGDSGEFLVAISAALDFVQTSEPLEKLTERLFLRYMETEVSESRPFYMHTAAAQVEAAKKLMNDQNVLFFPPEDMREELMEQVITKPEYLGCGHIKLMLGNPKGYGTPFKVTLSLIQSFFRYAWTHSEGAKKAAFDVHDHDHDHDHDHQYKQKSGNAEIVVLPGDHAELAVLQMGLDKDGVDDECQAPKVYPSYKTLKEAEPQGSGPDETVREQYFVNHSSGGYVQGLRTKNAEFFIREMGIKASTEDVVEAINALAGQQLGLTVGSLAGSLPIYSAEITSEHSSEC